VEDRDVLINTAFPMSDSEKYTKNVELQQYAMAFFSKELPGIPYPYPAFTTFINSPIKGSGGMEFPMMANNNALNNSLVIHEIFHSYIPMYVRTNEKRFVCLDEWADYIAILANERIYKNNYEPIFEYYKFLLDGILGSSISLPIITSTQFLDKTNKAHSYYDLPGFVISILHHHLGEELFQKSLEEFIVAWAKKSPTPYDFFYSFENTSGQDLSWLWKPWFFEFGDVDIAIKSFENGILEIDNNGSRPVPVQVILNYEDGTNKEEVYSASIWRDSNMYSVEVPQHSTITSLSVNRDLVDNSYENNFYPSMATALKYASFRQSDDYLGNYKGYYNFKLSRCNDLLFFCYTDFNQGTFFRPVSDSKFESLGGDIKVKFIVENGVCKGLKVSDYWGEWTAEKQ
jgi:hypothetical protein